MRGTRKRITSLVLIIMFFTVSVSLTLPVKTKSIDPFFTLVYLTVGGGRADYGNLLKEQLARIGINLSIIILTWSDFVHVINGPYYDYDICYASLTGGDGDPDFTSVYNENGSLNLFGYHTSMDWDDELDTGKNEWYMDFGTQIMPSDSKERIQHYWEWEDYLMDKICPMLPTFSPKSYISHWSDLEGYDIKKGILQSWGQMEWIGSHIGQVSTDELVISDQAWSDLNPMFQVDSSSGFISSAIMDPLIWYDEDHSVWPHLAESFEMINDTHIRIKVRENIKWQLDPEGFYPNEYLDAKDVYFTFYCWMKFSPDHYLYAWIDSMKIIDQYTIDIFIDGDPSSPQNEVYAPFLQYLNLGILPEHYLNQTQLEDNITPNITHSSWSTFATNCFGTGLFEMSHFDEGSETILSLFPNCWRLDPINTADPTLNWTDRFGFGAVWDGMHQLRIRIINTPTVSIAEFEKGKIDLVDVTNFPEKRVAIEENQECKVQSDSKFYMCFFGYNMRLVRPYIGSREPCPNDPSITIGLAIRKAINYATNRVEINNILHSGEYEIIDWPIFSKMSVWCNPDIIRYDHDLEKAKDYMRKAGFLYGDEPEEKWLFFKGLSVGGWLLITSPLYGIPIGFGIFFGVKKLIIRKRKISEIKDKFSV